MTHTEALVTESPKLHSLDDRQRLAELLLSPLDKRYHQFLIYLVYTTIKNNGRLTLNQLRHTLYGELLLSPTLIDGAVSVLASRSMFNCLSMYQVKMSKPDATPNFFLDVRESAEFSQWLANIEEQNPEFKAFTPPMYVKVRKNTEVSS